MATTLDVTADNRRLRFFDNFRVQELGPDDAVVQETDWESLSSEKENELSFRFPGETRTSLAVKYGFNARNQLTVQIVAQPGVPAASAVWTLPGKILVDDVEDLEYALLDDAGALTGRKLFVYAKLDFPEGYAKLRVTFPDGSAAFITGSNRERSLAASEYQSGGDLARDLLAFRAATRNTVDGEDEDMPADVKFYGRWDLHENALVFVTRYDNSAANPVAYLALGGQIKGTNFGLVLERDGTAALQIAGRYAWNKNTLAWDLQVGHSKSAGLEARLGAEAKFVGQRGTLTLKGGATLKKGAQTAALAFDLKLTYAAANRNLVFTMTGDGTGYQVQLSGDFTIRNSSVTFAISAVDKDGRKEVRGTVQFGTYTRNAELKLALESVLGRNGLTLKANLEFRFFWGPTGPVAQLP